LNDNFAYGELNYQIGVGDGTTLTFSQLPKPENNSKAAIAKVVRHSGIAGIDNRIYTCAWGKKAGTVKSDLV